MNRDQYRRGPFARPQRGLLPVCLAVLSAWFCLLALSAAAQDTKHLLRVSNPKLAAQLLQNGARLVQDYGGYQLIETTAEAAGVAKDDGSVEVCDQFNNLELRTGFINTSKPEVQQLRTPLSSFSGKRLHIVHFAGPIKSEWVQQLKATGAKIIGYL